MNADTTATSGNATSRVAEWHVITCEYPPQFGGVADYTYQVARGLVAAGDTVHIWTPASSDLPPNSPGTTVHTEFGQFSISDLRHVDQLLNDFVSPRRLLVQWVPHGYGYRAMNLVFCYWLRRRALQYGDQVELMVHEPYLPFSGSWRQFAAAAIQRLMTAVILRAPRKVWMSIPAWKDRLLPYALGRQVPFTWLPVISNVPEECDPRTVAQLREHYVRSGAILLGHYGTFGRAITVLLKPALASLLNRNTHLSVLLVGPGSEILRDDLIHQYPELAGRIHATGKLETVAECAHHLKACDLLFQPYPDGVSSRRTTFMAGLALQLPMVTTLGELSEPLWAESGAVCLTPINDVGAMVKAIEGLVDDPQERQRLAAAGKALYEERFTLSKIISTLRNR